MGGIKGNPGNTVFPSKWIEHCLWGREKPGEHLELVSLGSCRIACPRISAVPHTATSCMCVSTCIYMHASVGVETVEANAQERNVLVLPYLPFSSLPSCFPPSLSPLLLPSFSSFPLLSLLLTPFPPSLPLSFPPSLPSALHSIYIYIYFWCWRLDKRPTTEL